MAQTAEEALVVRMEATLTKFERQMARAKQVADQTSTGMEKRFAGANAKIAANAERAGSSILRMGSGAAGAGGMIQNASYQISDFATQVAGGTDASRAFAQQLPQLLGGLGLFGGVAGAAAAILLPLASNMIASSGGAKDLDDAMKGLSEAVNGYVAAVEAANASGDELIQKYSVMAEAAKVALSAIADAEKAAALASMAAAVDQIRNSLLESRTYSDSFLGTSETVLALKDSYGMTADEVGRVREALTALVGASGLEDTAAAAQGVADALLAAYGSVEAMPAPMQTVYGQMSKMVIEAASIQGAMDAASTSIWEFVSATAAGKSGLAGMAAEARGLASAAAAAATNLWEAARAKAAAAMSAQQNLAAGGKVYSGRGGDPRVSNTQGYGEFVYTGPALDAFNNPKAGGGGKGGGSGRAKEPFFGDLEGDLLKLEREIELLGRSSEEVATLKAKWELLDKAKKEGLDLDQAQAGSSRTLREEIDAQAAAVGRLTAQLEAQKVSQQAFEDGIDGIAEAMSEALVNGQSLREGLADVFRGIAADLAKAGIRDLLMGAFGGGGGFLSGIFGGGSKIASVPSIAKVAAASGKSAAAVEVVVTMDESTGKLGAFVRREAGGVAQAVVGAYDTQALPLRLKKVSADNRRIG